MKVLVGAVMVVIGGAAAYLWVRARRIAGAKMTAMEVAQDDQFLLSDPDAHYLGDPERGDGGTVRGLLVLTRRELVFVARDGRPPMHIARKCITAVDRDPPRLVVCFDSPSSTAPGGPSRAAWKLLHAEGWYRGLTAGPGVMRVPTSLPPEEVT